jgi:hypothetical protein
MDLVRNYLRLETSYRRYLGDLAWSGADDALVYEDGATFAFNEEVALFLEGFAGAAPLIHFGFMLHLLDLFRGTRKTATEELFRLRKIFDSAGGSLRNAGTFFAILCRDVPRALGPPDVRQVCERLRSPSAPIRWYVSMFHDTFDPAEQAPLGPVAFERLVLDALQRYSDQELRDWFRHGTGPVKEAGEDLARRLPVLPPPTLTGVLAKLLDRPRLAGVRWFVGPLVSALSLPPHRLAHQELAVGGYADVTTHGRPDQILPSQFALDEEDFFRRYAERELLYFRREEPRARSWRELVVLLDQGVRTWGDVRLILSAAALAFGKQAAKQGIGFLIATTGSGGALTDPLKAASELLGELVEASDLSPNPGLALERVLQEPARGSRDVVLLSHPRNLREPDVAAAARRVAGDVRLFAVALDSAGEADLCEVRHGTPVKLRHFRVDFSAATAAPDVRPPAAEAPSRWRGDVEPIGFPFRFGVGSPIGKDLFDFDAAGEWLLTGTKPGMLYAWKVDGTAMEVLPRGMVDGEVLTQVEAVVGVAGGFVVVGRIRRQRVVVHYDFAAGTCKAYIVGIHPQFLMNWHYSSSHHAIVGWSPKAWGWAVDLASGTCYTDHEEGTESRAKEAFALWKRTGLPSRSLHILSDEEITADSILTQPYFFLDSHGGQVQVNCTNPHWQPFTPQADGRPVLKGCRALQAQCAGNTLALMIASPGNRSAVTLRLFRGPAGNSLCEFSTRRDFGFMLSRDGRLLARQVELCRVEIVPVAGGVEPPLPTRKGGFSQGVSFLLGDRSLLLWIGEHRHYFLSWKQGTLEIRASRQDISVFIQKELVKLPSEKPAMSTPNKDLSPLARYDRSRFRLGAERDLIAVSDAFGQVALFDWEQKLVCMFFAFRGQVAAWMPDGTYLGPTALTGHSPTPDAAAKIGRVLQEASERGRPPR